MEEDVTKVKEVKVKDPAKVAQGKKNKKKGAAFELLVRKDMESKGWHISKWSNNIEFVYDVEGEIIDAIVISAKHKFNPFARVMTMGTGFPDYIAFKKVFKDYLEVIGVESKSNGYLDAEEKEKCWWLLNKEVFSKILVASKSKDGSKEIIYKEFIPDKPLEENKNTKDL